MVWIWFSVAVSFMNVELSTGLARVLVLQLRDQQLQELLRRELATGRPRSTRSTPPVRRS